MQNEKGGVETNEEEEEEKKEEARDIAGRIN